MSAGDLQPHNENTRLPRRPRQISHFLAQEMLYDYMQGRLEPDRKAAIENYLTEHSDLREELDSMRHAEEYAANLGKTRIAPKSLEQLREVRPVKELLINRLRWDNWPDFARWSTEALGVSVVVAVIALIVPWQKLDLSWLRREAQVTLAKIEDNKSILPAIPKPEEKKAAVAKPVEKPVTKPVDEDVRAKVESNQQKVITMKGLLYRIIMTSERAEAVSSDIVTKLSTMGAEKAGQVELGWRKKNPDGNYFHFSLPETGYNELIKTLGEYGPVRIYKNPHERVMPEGQIRIILWIEDRAPVSSTTQEASPEQVAPQDTTQENEATDQTP
jgi:hypothetical protein